MQLNVKETDLTRDRSPSSVIRKPYLAERVVFVGGYAGCGKSLMTPIVGSLARVEIQKYNYTLEHICSLYFLGEIEERAAIAMIRMLTDLDLYNMMMSRETNFRFLDMSSIFKNPAPWRYIRRLFQPGDAAVAERIRKEKPILQTMTHQLLVLSPPLFKALGDRLRIIEIVRHPLFMLKQWYLYIERYGIDARDFTICFNCEGHPLPFFARGWGEKYLRSNSMDKVIYSLAYLTRWSEEIVRGLSEPERKQVLIVPFERFVLDPWPYLTQIELFLETEMTSATRRELKRQKVPRKMIADGADMPIYRTYGWKPAEKGADETREFARRRQYAAELATPQAMEVLDQLCAAYEKKYFRGTTLETVGNCREAECDASPLGALAERGTWTGSSK